MPALSTGQECSRRRCYGLGNKRQWSISKPAWWPIMCDTNFARMPFGRRATIPSGQSIFGGLPAADADGSYAVKEFPCLLVSVDWPRLAVDKDMEIPFHA